MMMELDEWLAAFLLDCQARGLAKDTVRWYKSNLGLLRAYAEAQGCRPGSPWRPGTVITVHELRAYLVYLQGRERRYGGHPTRPAGGQLAVCSVAIDLMPQSVTMTCCRSPLPAFLLITVVSTDNAQRNPSMPSSSWYGQSISTYDPTCTSVISPLQCGVMFQVIPLSSDAKIPRSVPTYIQLVLSGWNRTVLTWIAGRLNDPVPVRCVQVRPPFAVNQTLLFT